MKKFLIGYDLLAPGQAYTRLIDELKRFGAVKVLASEWVLASRNSAEALRDHFAKFVDNGDRLLVSELTDWASWNAISDINKVAAA